MVSGTLIFFAGVFIVLGAFVIGIVLLLWWFKLKKIKKGAAKIDVNKASEVHSINLDKNKKPMYAPQTPQTQPTERGLTSNEKEIDKLEREIAETQQEIRELRETRGSSTGNGGVTVPETRESPKLYEGIPDSDAPKDTGVEREVRKSHKRHKSGGWKPI